MQVTLAGRELGLTTYEFALCARWRSGPDRF